MGLTFSVHKYKDLDNGVFYICVHSKVLVRGIVE